MVALRKNVHTTYSSNGDVMKPNKTVISSTVSLVIATYNRGCKLAPTLDSVLAQTVLPDEIVVVDDGSADGTGDWVRAHYPQVRVLTTANGGTSAARNRGAEAAQSEILMFLDHDDTLLPHAVETLSNLFRTFPEARAAFADHRYVNLVTNVQFADHHTEQAIARSRGCEPFPLSVGSGRVGFTGKPCITPFCMVICCNNPGQSTVRRSFSSGALHRKSAIARTGICTLRGSRCDPLSCHRSGHFDAHRRGVKPAPGSWPVGDASEGDAPTVEIPPLERPPGHADPPAPPGKESKVHRRHGPAYTTPHRVGLLCTIAGLLWPFDHVVAARILLWLPTLVSRPELSQRPIFIPNSTGRMTCFAADKCTLRGGQFPVLSSSILRELLFTGSTARTFCA